MEDEYIYIGKIVNTHGIKGELRLLSKFPYKDKVFIKDKELKENRDITEERLGRFMIPVD
mgnify:CR=1 FL=1